MCYRLFSMVLWGFAIGWSAGRLALRPAAVGPAHHSSGLSQILITPWGTVNKALILYLCSVYEKPTAEGRDRLRLYCLLCCNSLCWLINRCKTWSCSHFVDSISNGRIQYYHLASNPTPRGHQPRSDLQSYSNIKKKMMRCICSFFLPWMSRW